MSVQIRITVSSEIDKLLSKVARKLGKKKNNALIINGFYNLLPIGMYLGSGSHYFLCCHGGIDICYDPKPFIASEHARFDWITDGKYDPVPMLRFLGDKDRSKIAAELCKRCPVLGDHIHRKSLVPCISDIFVTPEKRYDFLAAAKLNPVVCARGTLLGKFFLNKIGNAPVELSQTGFAWSDFIIKEHGFLNLKTACRPSYGRKLSKKVFAFQSICGVFRAHQHNGEMMARLRLDGGITVLWDYDNAEDMVRLGQNAVCTFQLANSSGVTKIMYGEALPYDIFGLLTVGQQPEAWTLEKKQVAVLRGDYRIPGVFGGKQDSGLEKSWIELLLGYFS